MPLWHIHYCELKALKKQQVQGYSDSCFSSWKQEIKISYERYPPCPRRKEDIPTTGDREFGAEKFVQTNLVEPILIFLVTSLPFSIPAPNPFVFTILHNFIISSSKRSKSFLLWSHLQDFLLLWRHPCIHKKKKLIKCIYFFLLICLMSI